MNLEELREDIESVASSSVNPSDDGVYRTQVVPARITGEARELQGYLCESCGPSRFYSS